VLPAIITIDVQEDGAFSLEARVNLEALVAQVDPNDQDTDDSENSAEYDRLRATEPAGLITAFDGFRERWLAGVLLQADNQPLQLDYAGAEVPDVGDVARQRISTVRLQGQLPRDTQWLIWRYDEFFGESAVRVSVAGLEGVQSQFLKAGEVSRPLLITKADGEPLQSTWDVAIQYTELGFTHILPKGLDHILFVLGIFFLSMRLKPLLYQVTAFTVAHSITLALSLYGVVSLPASVVEPLIALSIVYVAVENIVTPELKPWRVWVVFAFGLLHGLGFAGVLTELGLPESEFVTALIAFNVGVEFGQLAVILIAFLVVGMFRNKPWYRSRIVIPASLAIAATGLYWTVERVFF